eukprot:m.250554 g.250554  ORF g.250554 m.250554 type:complete len:111 (+) comp40321_c3_seq45:617-949(+)
MPSILPVFKQMLQTVIDSDSLFKIVFHHTHHQSSGFFVIFKHTLMKIQYQYVETFFLTQYKSPLLEVNSEIKTLKQESHGMPLFSVVGVHELAISGNLMRKGRVDIMSIT